MDDDVQYYSILLHNIPTTTSERGGLHAARLFDQKTAPMIKNETTYNVKERLIHDMILILIMMLLLCCCCWLLVKDEEKRARRGGTSASPSLKGIIIIMCW